MHVTIAGAGPTGLMVGAALARRGHLVTAVDRDPGPAPDGSWQRRGVMQFEHAHAFRGQVRAFLLQEWPEAYAEWERLGVEVVTADTPDGPVVIGNRSRRSTFEHALRTAATRVPGLEVRTGHVDRLVEEEGRVSGVVVDGTTTAADLVVDATGRSGRLAAGHGEPSATVGDCGLAYVDRVYRLRPGTEPGPLDSGIAQFGPHDGYLTLLFPHERGYFSVVFVRPTADQELKDLRHLAAFEAATAAAPRLAEWTGTARSEPVSEVMVGGALRNVYHPQRPAPGLVTVGDAVATTTPTAGRGVAMCAMQIEALLALLDGGADPTLVAEPFGLWCDQHMQPWVADHVVCDGTAARRWQGAELDVEAPLTSADIISAAEQDPRIMAGAGAYVSMTGLPETLRAYEELARDVYRTGWRPAYDEGPSRDELVAIVQGALAPA